MKITTENKSNTNGSFEFDTIYTMDARTNIMLSSVTSQFNLTPIQVFNEITNTYTLMRKLLERKGIDYKKLKSALIPSHDKWEIAFAFDKSRKKKPWVGTDVIELVLQLMDRRSTNSLLCGDWLLSLDKDRWFIGEFLKEIHTDGIKFIDHNNIYIVYLNNLSQKMLANIDRNLRDTAFYIGYLDLRFTTPCKTFLSRMLVRYLIKSCNTLIGGHLDDLDENEDFNIVGGLDLAKCGYVIRTVPYWMYGLFLSYKIEAPVLDCDTEDVTFSLNAVSTELADLAKFDIEVKEAKANYLRNAKAGSLKRANMEAFTAQEIATQIKSKIRSNYIYNLSRSKNGEVIKFNIMLEYGRKVKHACSLEYIPADLKLRIITFY